MNLADVHEEGCIVTERNTRSDGIPGRVAIVHNSDFQMEGQGGTDAYVRGLTGALEGLGIETWQVDVAIASPRRIEREIVVARHPISNYIAPLFLCRAALRMRSRRDWIVHVQRPEQLLPFLLIAGRKRLLVTTVHGPVREAMRRMRSGPTASAYSLLERIGLKIAGAVIFVNRRAYDSYIELYPWLKAKSHVIPTGVEPAFFEESVSEIDAKKKFGFKPNEKIICFVGRLNPEKNVDLILRSFAGIAKERKDLRLAIAGEGGLRSELEELSRNLGIGNQVVFLGKVPHPEIKSLLAASDILVLASRWEGSPTVIKEALATRTRIVTTNVGDVGEIINDASLGTVVSEADERSLAEGMKAALQKARPAEIQPSIRRLGWDCIGESILALYRQAVTEKGNKKRDL